MKKRCVLLCFLDLGDSKIDPKIDAGKKASKCLSGAHHSTQRRKIPIPAESAPAPGAIISKDFLRKKTEKKANRRVQTRWSAKSGVQKAHTERQVRRQPTTDVNTLVGLRPPANSKGERAFRRARFLCLSVCGVVGAFVWGFATK